MSEGKRPTAQTAVRYEIAQLHLARAQVPATADVVKLASMKLHAAMVTPAKKHIRGALDHALSGNNTLALLSESTLAARICGDGGWQGLLHLDQYGITIIGSA